MIRVGQREFFIPKWLWAVLPLAALLYACVDLGWGTSSSLLLYSDPDKHFVVMMMRLGTAWLAAFLLIDVAVRSRTPWYGLPLLYLIVWAAAIFVVYDGVAPAIEWLVRAGPVGALLIIPALPLVLAPAVALVVTFASRMVEGLPLWSRDTFRDLWASLAGAILWLLICIGGYLAIRFHYDVHMGAGRNVPFLVPWLAACIGAFAAASLHLGLVHLSRRRQASTDGHLSMWLVTGLCVLSFLFKPDLLGITGARVNMDYVRPALRFVGILPTPVVRVASYRIDIPYVERGTVLGQSQPGQAGYPFAAVRLPVEYGLPIVTPGRPPGISVLRRDAPDSQVSSYWTDIRKGLNEAARAARPGEDVLFRYEHRVLRTLALRMSAYPELEFGVTFLDPATPWDVAEAALRRFLQERLRPAS